MKDIYQDVEKQIANPALVGMGGKTKVIGFMYMEDLQTEIEKFLQEYELPTLLAKKANWLEFVKLLVKILADQPINTPCADIKQFAFLPAADGCVRGRIDFTKNIGKYIYNNSGNDYKTPHKKFFCPRGGGGGGGGGIPPPPEPKRSPAAP